MNVLDLFSGIGGFSLGLEMASPEFETVAFCEIDEYPRSVLKKHWPGVPIYNDIKEVTHERLQKDGIPTIELICGGFPCQPYSQAGKRRGAADDRDQWPEMLRVIQEIRPTWVIGENVAGINSLFQSDSISEMEGVGYSTKEEAEINFNGISERTTEGMLAVVLGGLERIGYEVQSFIVPACGVGARHRRDRVWILAHTNSKRCGKEGAGSTGKKERAGRGSPGTGALANPSFEQRQERIDIGRTDSGGSSNQFTGSSENVANTGINGPGTPHRAGKGSDANQKQNNWNKVWDDAGNSGGAVPDAPGRGMERDWSDWQQKPRTQIEKEISGRDGSGNGESIWTVEPDVGRMVDGVSEILDSNGNVTTITTLEARKKRLTNLKANRLKGLGNAVVPQVVAVFGRALLQAHYEHQQRGSK